MAAKERQRGGRAEAVGLRTTRTDILRFRLQRHQLDRPAASIPAVEVGLLDLGVQDTGPDGSAWALAVRGARAPGDDELALAWTLRAAPHRYRRVDLVGVATATAPYSEADAAKRIFDVARPLRAAGTPILEALRVVADHEREIVVDPTVKGEVSQALNGRLPPPYLRDCRPCGATHIYEMTFRLAALHAGLELEAGTSPPVLRRFDAAPPRFGHLAAGADPRLDVLRGYLRFFGPARMKDVAAFVDMTLAEVRAHWPQDAVEVDVADAPAVKRSDARFVLADDVDALVDGGGGADAPVVRLLGPHDPYLQLRDRELLVPDAARRRALWPVLGRPGAVVIDGEVAGSWRPRTVGRALTVRLEPWRRLTEVERRLVGDQAERLADHRGVTLAGVDDEG